MRVEDHIEIVETGYDNLQKARMRYEVGKKGGNNEISFNQDLGLACESLPKDLTLDQLWKIV
jgi:hypothetical protein